MPVGKALGRGKLLVGPGGGWWEVPDRHGARTRPHSLLAESSVRFSTAPRWCVAACHPKTGFERQVFETKEARASWASQSKQAFGKFIEKQTGLNFPSDSPKKQIRLPGGWGASGSSAPVLGWLLGGERDHQERPLRHCTAAPQQLVLGPRTAEAGQFFL